MYTLGAGEILIKSIIIVCLLNLMAWKASCAHKTGENEEKNNIKIKRWSKRRAPVVRSGDQDYSCSMLLYHVISTTCSHAGGWGSTALGVC